MNGMEACTQIVSLAAVFSIVTQRSSKSALAPPHKERCVTILKTAARETSTQTEPGAYDGLLTEPNLFAVADPGVGPGGQAPPPYYYTKLRPKGPKNFISYHRTPPPPPHHHLISGSG